MSLCLDFAAETVLDSGMGTTIAQSHPVPHTTAAEEGSGECSVDAERGEAHLLSWRQQLEEAKLTQLLTALHTL